MKIFNEIGPLRAYLKEITPNGRTVGLVPTMGALHQGHPLSAGGDQVWPFLIAPDALGTAGERIDNARDIHRVIMTRYARSKGSGSKG